ncbi:MAG: helix-hairpin-helix domain-containing protein [Gammaproteobacteria bacterium]
MAIPLNDETADQLRQIADLLEQQGANPFRVNAYRRGAATVDGLDVDVRQLLEQGGLAALTQLPKIGEGIARAIYEIAATGRCSRLERLRGQLDPEHLFQTIPGVGPEMARRIHEHLQIDSLEALEMAAHDGRLEQVPGVGPRRVAAVRAALSTLLGRRTRGRHLGDDGPPVDVLLDVDRDYRRQAASGALPTIAPRRFNPEGKAWLPVLHASRGDWHFTALYSNTARAHELGRTRDWVVLYFSDDQHHEGQCTVVTETHGPLAGRRVVRGREAECTENYRRQG